MFRISYRAAICGVLASLAVAAGEAGAASVALVCDGEFRMQRASVEGTTEAMFAGTMHVAPVQGFSHAAQCPLPSQTSPSQCDGHRRSQMVWLSE